MPHTNRRKKHAVAKRIEVQDGDGWTRVTTTTTNGARRRPRTSEAQTLQSHTDHDSSRMHRTVPEPGSTVSKIRVHYEKIDSLWKASEACRALVDTLKSQVLQAEITDGSIDKCIVFGTASFCGLRDGWIKSADTALCQLAVLKTIQSTIGETLGQMPQAMAQEPAYNDLDIEFLRTLDVEVAETPQGFEQVTQKSLVYTPCSEGHVLRQVLEGKPAILLGKSVDWYARESGDMQPVRAEEEPMQANGQDGDNQRDKHDLRDEKDIFETYRRGSNAVRLPDFAYRDRHPFRDEYLYWKLRFDNA